MNRWRKIMEQLHKAYRGRRDDRGSAIVVVIIAMAMIGIMATTLMWMAYMNYMIKVNDIKNKNSFYSAEIVVEQIMAGVQIDVSRAVGSAYEQMATEWGMMDDKKMPVSEAARYKTFATSYMDALVKTFKDTTRAGNYYDRNKLKAYIDADLFDASSPTKGVDVNAWNNGNRAGASKKEPEMEMVNDNSLILHNIYVSYTDSNGLVSIVQTDICIDVPKLVFTQNGSIDELYNYVLIGNEGIEMTMGSGTTRTEGSVFAGTDDHNKGGILINAASTLDMSDAKNVISKGDIRLEGPAAGMIVKDVPGEANRVFAQNIYLNSGTISLDSKTYVANDLSLNGSGSKATLTKEYYGYGASAYNGLPGEPDIDSSASSAIVINGRNSTIDMSGIKRLMIAGRSYIGQSTTMAEAAYKQAQIEAGLETAGQPVMMGESIAVKGGQIAYLVPAECIGTMDGELLYGQNPLAGDKESDLQADKAAYGDLFNEVDFFKKVYRLGNKSLSEFGVTDMRNIRKVFAQYNGGTLVYYYLVMSKDDAEKYFVQYYDFTANKEALDGYFTKYASGGILLGDYTAATNQYTILGNSLVSDALSASGVTLLTGFDQTTLMPGDESGDGSETGDGSGTVPGGYQEVEENADPFTSAKTEAEVVAAAQEINEKYTALYTNLSEDYSSIGVGQNVYNSVIKEVDVQNYLSSHGGRVRFYTDIDAVSGYKSGLQAVVTNESDVSLSALGDCSDIRLIVSTGNVTVDKNFTGLIVAKGKITIDGTAAGGVASIKRNQMELYKVLNAQSGISGDTITPLDMFVNGSGSMSGGASSAEVDAAGNLQIDYGEIVRYMNWIKK